MGHNYTVKRARDIVKSSTVARLSITKSNVSNVRYEIDKSVALELISKLGEDEKQDGGHYTNRKRGKTARFIAQHLSALV